MAKILITAANGNTGFPAAKALLALGHQVRAFVRNPEKAKAKELKKLGAEIFQGDMLDIRSVRAALHDIDSAYFVPTYPNVLFQGNTFAAAANEFRLKHVLVMTQWLSSNAHPSLYTKEHWLVDETFKRLQHTELTFINPGLFAFVYFLMPEPMLQLGIMPDFGTNAPPSNEDIGLVAAHILKAPDKHTGKTYKITSRDLLTAPEMAEIVSNYLGRKVNAQVLPEGLMLKMLRSYGFPKMDASQIRHYVKDAQNGTFAIHAPTNTVRDIVGKEADDFLTITKRYLDNHPLLKASFMNRLQVMGIMVRAMLTPKWNMPRYEIEQRFPNFENMIHSKFSEEWQFSHSI